MIYGFFTFKNSNWYIHQNWHKYIVHLNFDISAILNVMHITNISKRDESPNHCFFVDLSLNMSSLYKSCTFPGPFEFEILLSLILYD